MKTCSHEGCTNIVRKGGVCKRHGAKLLCVKTCSQEVPTNHEEKKEYAVNVLQITKYNGVAVSCCCFHQQFEEGEEVANSCPVTEQFQIESFAICLSRGNSPLCKVNNVFMMFHVLQFVRKRL